MKRSIKIAVILAVAFHVVGQSQEVIITGFPPGIGSDTDPGIFEPYHLQLSALADTLHRYPLSMAIVTGGADGIRFSQDHNAKNPGLALGRALTLRNLLVAEYNIDSDRIVIQSNYVKVKGDSYRYASARVVRDLSDLEKRIDFLEDRPPAEQHITEVKEIFHAGTENMGIQLSAGFSSSPFGGMPIITGAITWKRVIFIEGIFGHTLWNDSFRFEDLDLNTRRRMTGALATVYPLADIPVGLTGGWLHVEEISRRYSEYVKMSEGPVIGLRVTPFDFLSITVVQNTANQNIAGESKSRLKGDQFLLFVTLNLLLGGGQ